MKRFLRSFQNRLAAALCLTFALSASASQTQPAWPQAGSDLKPNPKVTFGSFANGLRYAILPHDEPPGRVSLRLIVASGSLQESEDQRGLAHYLEHMAFNGTENYAAGEMVEYFQRLGMAFGADTNAYTSFDETVYFLELPNASESIMRDSLLLLRDYAVGMLLSPEEIESERGVILSEKRVRDTPDFRAWRHRLNFIFPGSRLAERFPIGVHDVIAQAKRPRFLEYYQTWYRPERMTLVAVGNIDAESFVPLLREYMGEIKRETETPKEVAIGPLKRPSALEVQYAEEPELGYTSIELYHTRPIENLADTRTERERRIYVDLANDILNQRLNRLAKKVDAPFLEGSAYERDWLRWARNAVISLRTQPAGWRETVAVAEQELRRMLEHGVTRTEVDEARARLRSALEQAAAEAPTRKSRQISSALAGSINQGNVFTSPEQELELYVPMLEAATAASVLKAFRASWGYAPEEAAESDLNAEDIEEQSMPPYRLLVLGGPLEAEEEQIFRAFVESYGETVEAPAEDVVGPFAYQDFGEPGEVAEREKIEDLGITRIVFKNGVTLLAYPNDLEANRIRLQATFGDGRKSEPAALQGVAQLAEWSFIEGGLRAHSMEDIDRLYSGKTASVNFVLGEDAFALQGDTRPVDLRDQLNLMAAYLTAPGYREEARRQAAKFAQAYYPRLKNNPIGIFQKEGRRFLASGDHRVGVPPQEVFAERTLEEVAQWLQPALQENSLELAVAGDFELDALIEAAAATFGALPERSRAAPYGTVPGPDFPSGVEARRFLYRTELPKGLAMVAWPTTDRSDIHEVRRIGLLGRIFGDRLRVRIREELGATYSPGTGTYTSDAYTDFGYLFGFVEVEPAQTQEVAGKLASIGQKIPREGITKDELERAKTPLVEAIAQQRRNNGYWLENVMAGSSRRPEQLNWARTIEKDFASITVEELEALAKRYLREEPLRLTIIPESAVAD